MSNLWLTKFRPLGTLMCQRKVRNIWDHLQEWWNSTKTHGSARSKSIASLNWTHRKDTLWERKGIHDKAFTDVKKMLSPDWEEWKIWGWAESLTNIGAAASQTHCGQCQQWDQSFFSKKKNQWTSFGSKLNEEQKESSSKRIILQWQKLWQSSETCHWVTELQWHWQSHTWSV